MLNLWESEKKIKERQTYLQELKPVIIMSRGHSGTRVISFACSHLGLKLGTTEGLATGDADNQTFTQKIKKLAVNNYLMVDPVNVVERDLIFFQKAVMRYHEELGSPGELWGWKFPETYLISPYVARTFPHARYLHLVRDGRDIAFKNHLTDDPTRKLGKKLLSSINALEEPHHIQAGMSWAYQVDNFDQFREFIKPQQVMDMRFEDLCMYPHETISNLCEFLQLPMTDSCKTYLDTKIDTSKVAQYKESDPALVREVESRIKDTLSRYRYL
ncbi:MAG: sulfotransferase [SAR324 cluster bacterium]|nr:sulfotransferase [SAR324 cluster bacterium]